MPLDISGLAERLKAMGSKPAEKKYEPYVSTASQGTQDLFNKIYGGGDTGYKGIFNQAFGNLNQPETETGQNDIYRQNIANRATQTLAEKFIDEYHKKFNALPGEDTVRDFVAQNLNPQFASKFILEQISPDQIGQMTRTYIGDNAMDIAPQSAQNQNQTTPQNLADQISALYNEQRAALPQQVERAYAPAKGQMIEDLAAQGLLRSPASRLSLNQVENEKQNSLTQALASLAGQQAQGGQALQNTLAQLSQQANQFGRDLALRKQQFGQEQYQYDTGLGLQRQQMNLASQIGRMQAENNKPGWMDYLNTALGGLSALGNAAGGAGTAYKAFK